jgi:hypothetical protein
MLKGMVMIKRRERKTTRRQFVGTAAALGVMAIVPRHVVAGSGKLAPSEKMNVGCVDERLHQTARGGQVKGVESSVEIAIGLPGRVLFR